ncbi:MAG: hypothetical protein JO354_08470 [Verrucomicrobia bacterium]|nr:hypothetical protein [Verrucomicrobiota bacterium]
MKAFLLGSVASLVLALAAHAQTPAPSIEVTVTPAAAAVTPSSAPVISPNASVAPSAADDLANKIQRRVEREFKHNHGFGITVDDSDNDSHDGVSVHRHTDQIPGNVVPIVAICMLAVFGFPVAIVAVIMGSSWAKSRSLHRTVRMMVEKGQPVPPELFASRAGTPLRPWYDLRRGIILLAFGIGIIFFFGVTAGWDVGVWTLGLIPAIIGLGYILTWRLANRHGNGVKL